MGVYDDMLRLPHHRSEVRAGMSAAGRAAQFAPFAALSGHEQTLQEAGRLTQPLAELDESAREALNRTLQELLACPDAPQVRITHFQPDHKKAGGAYVTVSGRIDRVDMHARVIRLSDGRQIDLDLLSGLERLY